MNIQYLIFANTIIIVVYLYFTRTYKTKIIIDHFALLLAGIIFYWLMPIYVYENDLTSHHYLLEFYESIHIENIKLFLFFTLLIVFSILLSDFISRKFPVVISVKNFQIFHIITLIENTSFLFYVITLCLTLIFHHWASPNSSQKKKLEQKM